MSCLTCNSNSHSSDKCYEARLMLGLNNSKTELIGSIDGTYIKPVDLEDAIKANETNTTLRYDPSRRSLIFNGERSKSTGGAADIVTSSEILSGADISELGSVGELVNGGLASSVVMNNRLGLKFEVPTPIENSETSDGFVVYVPNPNNQTSHYRLIRPDPGGSSDTVLVGHPDGSVEFTSPITSPVLVPVNQLTSNGHFSGTPSTSAGSWRYQQMGQSQIITNTSGSRVEVSLEIRWSAQFAGSRGGFYASLVSGGSDYQSNFVEGKNDMKQEGMPGGYGRWVCLLAPNQRCQFRFGAWTNNTGNMTVTIGSYSENGTGTPVNDVQQPRITIRRLI